MKKDKKKYPGHAASFLGGMASVFDIGGILRNPFYNPVTFRNNNTTSVKSYFDATCSYLKDAQSRLIHESKELQK